MSADPQNDPRPGDLLSGLLRKILNRLANIPAVGLGYTAENVANKVNDPLMTPSVDSYPTTEAVFNFAARRFQQVGTVKLTAGAGSFTLSNVTTGCVVLLTHRQIVGSPGFLSCTITDGVGVDVTSTNGADASYVDYAVTFDYS